VDFESPKDVEELVLEGFDKLMISASPAVGSRVTEINAHHNVRNSEARVQEYDLT
jgi:hypothetical protein